MNFFVFLKQIRLEAGRKLKIVRPLRQIWKTRAVHSCASLLLGWRQLLRLCPLPSRPISFLSAQLLAPERRRGAIGVRCSPGLQAVLPLGASCPWTGRPFKPWCGSLLRWAARAPRLRPSWILSFRGTATLGFLLLCKDIWATRALCAASLAYWALSFLTSTQFLETWWCRPCASGRQTWSPFETSWCLPR